MSSINLKTSRPSKDMTDAQWQEYFEQMRSSIRPTTERKMRRTGFRYRQSSALDIPDSYHGETMWQRYCDFINGILSSIRHGESDYCFYTYQIAELLRFENTRLRSEWMPNNGCFRVWIQK